MFAQPDLERLLDARARSLPSVDVHRGCEVVGLAASADGVALARGGTPTARPRERRAPATSSAATAPTASSAPTLGATVTDLGFFFDWLIVDVIPHEPRVWQPLNVQICDPARPTTLVSGGPGRRRWEFMRLPGESIEELNNEETAWRLLAPWGVPRRERDPRAPRRLQVPGALGGPLARAAACSSPATPPTRCRRSPARACARASATPPTSPGSSTWCWRSKPPDALLDTYASERVPHVRAVIELLDGARQGDLRRRSRRGGGARRDDDRRRQGRLHRAAPAAAARTRGRVCCLRGDPSAGQLFLQGRVRHGGATGLFDDVVGRGWTLLSPSVDPAARLDPEIAAFFASIGGDQRTGRPRRRRATTSMASTPAGSRSAASPSSCSAPTSTSSAPHPPPTVPARSSASCAVR